ncbi:hypothetical protein G4B88_004419 [Cannabis sativa]|uniref:Uncharacterized protein n=1 Tax=Cannabis sativa TaxID=3483 RepID=A0A7J6HPS5_CANSA|nr:hypothetical protein G4B88_009130 [Cannabis sativa]KAF4400876.1 hypothetical protein G4B88_004419 [Cannabis sativa]
MSDLYLLIVYGGRCCIKIRDYYVFGAANNDERKMTKQKDANKPKGRGRTKKNDINNLKAQGRKTKLEWNEK